MAAKHVISVDLGAESGRVMQVNFDGSNISVEEVHRFPNTPVYALGKLYWDVLRLWHEISTGIHKVPAGAASIGVDTWGVDFVPLDKQGHMLANPVHYRDQHKEGMFEWVFERVPRRAVFERTGIQFMIINGVYEMARLVRDQSSMLDAIGSVVPIADLFNYWLTGEKSCEYTLATTWQIFNPRSGNWDYETISALGLPANIFPQIIQPGTKLGEYQGIPVIVSACHDTASAVVAVPTTTANYAYVSSGTWSLFGLEINEPIINDAAYQANITNEGGVYGTFRLLKNVCGMWIPQQCRATWREQGAEYSYDQLAKMATEGEPFRSLIDVDDPLFLPPGDMPSRIREFCQRTRQPVPETPAQMMRTAYESLALKYRLTLEKLIALTGNTVDRLHIIGGGSQNTLLNQMTANAIGRVVVAGPTEATAMGNAIVQLIALGELSSMSQAREILSQTVGTKIYEPQDTSQWDEAYGRYQQYVTTE
jgi:rhamnulokinase